MKARDTRDFDVSHLKGLKQAERYKSHLENKFDRVTVVTVGLDRVRITGVNAEVTR
jgi:hypothetical protein